MLRKTTFAMLPVLVLGFFISAGSALADQIITVSTNSASFGGGPIQTYQLDLTNDTSTQVGSFVPEGAAGNNGRGLAVTNTQIYYTELTGSFGPSDGIHVAPFNGGAGGADSGVLPNGIPGTGISALTFATGGSTTGDIYALTGYPNGPESVFEFDPSSGIVIKTVNGSINNLSDSDGFTVLPNGNFLINNGDAVNAYNQYDPNTGAIIPGTTISVSGSEHTTGVTTFNNDLFFVSNFDSIVETDLSGNTIQSFTLPGTFGEIENLSLQENFNPPPPGGSVPEPGSLMLFGTGLVLVGLSAIRRKFRPST